MSQRIIQGNLRMTRENLVSDMSLIRERVLSLTEPQAQRAFAGEHQTIWSVDFTATEERWKELEPELRKRGIGISIYEAPHHYRDVQEAEKRVEDRIGKRSTRALIRLLASVMIAAIGLIVLRQFFDIGLLGSFAVFGIVAFLFGFNPRGRMLSFEEDARDQSLRERTQWEDIENKP